MFKLRPLSVRASYAGGFRAPTLKEMYMCFDMAGIQMIYGNPDLKPRKAIISIWHWNATAKCAGAYLPDPTA